jgi:hypothetical protein
MSGRNLRWEREDCGAKALLQTFEVRNALARLLPKDMSLARANGGTARQFLIYA